MSVGLHTVRRLRYDEAAFAVAVATAVGATAHELDVGDRPGVVDAELAYPDGHTAALEVTSYAGEGIRLRNSELAKQPMLPTAGTWTWFAYFDSAKHLPEFRRRVGRIVAGCEAAGIRDPRRLRSWDTVELSDLKWLFSTGIRLHGHPQSSRPGEVFLLSAARAARVDEALEGLPYALERVLRRDTVLKRATKVANSDYDERHLCVWLLEGAVPEPVAFGLMQRVSHIDAAPPVRPRGVTHMWFLPAYGWTLLGITPTGWASAEAPEESAP